MCTSAPRWIGTWSTSLMLVEPGDMPPAPGLSGNTLRQIIYASIGGHRLRVRLSNAYGDSPLRLLAVHLARSFGGTKVDSKSDLALSFSGSSSATLAPGEDLVSDSIDFEFEPLTQLAITIHFGVTPNDVTGHPGSRMTSYLVTGAAVDVAELPTAVPVEHWYVISGIDVVSSNSPGAIVTLGDSITDGRGSTIGGNNRWPDCLSRRLRVDPATREIAVLNAGIGGNHLVEGGLGPACLRRFERDVILQTGTRWLILLEGVNDIGTSIDPRVAGKLIAAFEHCIAAAHRHDVSAYGAPILPFGGSQYASSEHEAARQTVNNWIRTSGRFDAVIDMDAAVRDPKRPAALLPEYDCGDHLHLSPAGLQRLADVVDLELFRV
jgi:lysophospholipase L1-like esterase